MFLKKKLKPEHVEDTNYIVQLYWLDWRFDGPDWMYIWSELYYYRRKRKELVQKVIEYEGQYTYDKYEKDRIS